CTSIAVARSGGGVSSDTTIIVRNATGAPNTPAAIGCMPHHSSTGWLRSTPNTHSRIHGCVCDIYAKVAAKPASMPNVAPHLLARRQKMPMTRAGKNDDAANENAADTMNRMSAGLRAATQAAAKATASSNILDTITRRAAVMRGDTRRYHMSCDREFDRVSSRPSAVDSAAASPPAATSPDTT